MRGMRVARVVATAALAGLLMSATAGELYDERGQYQGRIDDGEIYDERGRYQGRIVEEDGELRLYDERGRYLGTVRDDGDNDPAAEDADSAGGSR